jgi:membrane-anchored glycerophosphoryl diester phosphodiesterase (GDPDase)
LPTFVLQSLRISNSIAQSLRIRDRPLLELAWGLKIVGLETYRLIG